MLALGGHNRPHSSYKKKKLALNPTVATRRLSTIFITSRYLFFDIGGCLGTDIFRLTYILIIDQVLC